MDAVEHNHVAAVGDRDHAYPGELQQRELEPAERRVPQESALEIEYEHVELAHRPQRAQVTLEESEERWDPAGPGASMA